MQLPLPPLNRLNQSKSVTFSILPCCAFFRNSAFLFLLKEQMQTLCTCIGMKRKKQDKTIILLAYNIIGKRVDEKYIQKKI
jgi:hypothetical protein